MFNISPEELPGGHERGPAGLGDAVLDSDADAGQRLHHPLHRRLVREREHDRRWKENNVEG